MSRPNLNHKNSSSSSIVDSRPKESNLSANHASARRRPISRRRSKKRISALSLLIGPSFVISWSAEMLWYHPLGVETASRRNDLVNQLPASNVHQLTGISTNIAPFAVRRLGCWIHHIFRVS